MDGNWLNIMVVPRHKSFDGAEEKCCFTIGMICLYLFICSNATVISEVTIGCRRTGGLKCGFILYLKY